MYTSKMAGEDEFSPNRTEQIKVGGLFCLSPSPSPRRARALVTERSEVKRSEVVNMEFDSEAGIIVNVVVVVFMTVVKLKLSYAVVPAAVYTALLI